MTANEQCYELSSQCECGDMITGCRIHDAPWEFSITTSSIGQGSFGRVFRMLDPNSGLVVAAKLVHIQHRNLSQNLPMLLNELLVHLLVYTYDSSITIGMYQYDIFATRLRINLLMMMELLDIEKVADYSPMAITLAKIHNRGILHNDITVNNMGIYRDENQTIQYKLIDWGVALFDPTNRIRDLNIDENISKLLDLWHTKHQGGYFAHQRELYPKTNKGQSRFLSDFHDMTKIWPLFDLALLISYKDDTDLKKTEVLRIIDTYKQTIVPSDYYDYDAVMTILVSWETYFNGSGKRQATSQHTDYVNNFHNNPSRIFSVNICLYWAGYILYIYIEHHIVQSQINGEDKLANLTSCLDELFRIQPQSERIRRVHQLLSHTITIS